MKRLCVLLLLFLLFLSCTSEDSSLIEEYGDYKFIDEEYTLSYNSRDDIFIGNIRDITTDKNGNLYVLDSQNRDIKKFGKDGELLRIYGQGVGRGPGEFQDPIAIAVDSLDNIYVAEMMNQKISIIDSDNIHKADIPLHGMPARIVVDDEKNIYVVSFSFSSSTPDSIVTKYMYERDWKYREDIKFGNRPNNTDANLIAMAGNADLLSMDSKGNLYVSLWYPYEVQKYNTSGELLDSYNREVSFFEDPKENSNGVVMFTSGVLGSFIIPEQELIINQLFHKDDGNWSFTYDAIDLSNSTHKGSFTMNESIEPEHASIVENDRNGNIYIATNIPIPTVYKYEIVKNDE